MSEKAVAAWDEQVRQWRLDTGAPTPAQLTEAQTAVEAFMQRQERRAARHAA